MKMILNSSNNWRMDIRSYVDSIKPYQVDLKNDYSKQKSGPRISETSTENGIYDKGSMMHAYLLWI